MLSPTLRIDRVLTQFWHSNGRPLVRFKLGTVRLTEEVVKNQSAPFGVACTEMGGILPSLVATNSALKMQSSQDLFARPKQENGLHSLANITIDPTGNGSGSHSETTPLDLESSCCDPSRSGPMSVQEPLGHMCTMRQSKLPCRLTVPFGRART
jgi:hypothetical protein